MSLAPGAPPDVPPQLRARVRYSTALARSIPVVTANGEIDAANALTLSRHVEAELDSVSRLVVDLSALEFFGTQGFSILHRINVMCSRFAVNWTLVAGPEVDRVLHICDPDGGLPVADTLEAALRAVTRPPRSHLRLVSNR
ncbi:STAS domain-containing protein [Mycolicibacterium sp. 050158]|jgi:anti-anti-sigma factor|uniref:STAS domain-containing protein n=1 Tax=Mycolicibacterium sp. 050158 TaxID=3090602 RepID=UPI00299D04CA|nr:STAS domain-containing protein [Mycolicibacterium sp. 050158]MDX1890362.1 STAS domain-containing protein [Mycolicibacterium sp. 050158]